MLVVAAAAVETEPVVDVVSITNEAFNPVSVKTRSVSSTFPNVCCECGIIHRPKFLLLLLLLLVSVSVKLVTLSTDMPNVAAMAFFSEILTDSVTSADVMPVNTSDTACTTVVAGAAVGIAAVGLREGKGLGARVGSGIIVG